ncbi:hypothetical protein AAVH_23968 [Aphelenchoides avenae]|nr:hypothetical protein AAVH_23968 [Aphelenchus avenae]
MEPSDSKRLACRSLRTFFENTHLQATVKRIFVWLNIDNDQFQFAHQSQLVPALRYVIAAAAKWVTSSSSFYPCPTRTPCSRSSNLSCKSLIRSPSIFQMCSGSTTSNASTVLASPPSLGSNAFITYWTAVDQMGRVSRKSVRAALRFLRQLKSSLVPADADLSDPVKPESALSSQQQSTSPSPSLHNVYRGKVQKHHREDYAARGAPHKRGGGGRRGQWNSNRRGQGNRRS